MTYLSDVSLKKYYWQQGSDTHMYVGIIPFTHNL